MVLCSKCKTEKSRDKFRKRKGTYNGLQYWCRDCENEANRKRYVPKPKKTKIVKDADVVKRNARDRMLQYRYDITLDDYNKMYEKQNGKCKICEQPFDNGGVNGLYVDHCHKTGKVRDLLCPRCNSLLGKFLENEDYIKKALKYLNTHI